MFIEITQPDNFSWASILVTSLVSIISASLGAGTSYYFLELKDRKTAKANNAIALTIIKEKVLIMEKNIQGYTSI